LYGIIYSVSLFFFTTGCSEDENIDSNICKDVDGNVYDTVTIGTQVWMAENLKVTHFRNGDSIINITDQDSWNSMNSAAYCDYNNTPGNSTIYGRLYNWFAITDNRNIAPKGWHVPSRDEWKVLIDYLGGDTLAYNKLLETGTVHWQSPNEEATNESGFTALPGGLRSPVGIWPALGTSCHLWTTEDLAQQLGVEFNMYIDRKSVYHQASLKINGLSVRCIKDE
jgi:uncharacterized protein (TIGR02145 family)